MLNIITVVCNDSKNISKTIDSVLKHISDHVRYFILDGGSIDGTLEIIKKHHKQNDNFYYQSSSDSGVYDAMNKALLLSGNDDHVLFINSGDVVDELVNFAEIDFSADVIFCSTVCLCESRTFYKNYTIDEVTRISSRNMFSVKIHHQGFICRRRVHQAFDTGLGELADLDVMINVINNKSVSKIFMPDIHLSRYTLGGISDCSGLKRLFSYWRLCRKHKESFLKLLLYNFKGVSKLLLKQIFPYSVISYFRKKIL